MCFNFFKKKDRKNETTLWQPESQLSELQLREQQSTDRNQDEQFDASASAEFNFKLTIENCRIQDGHREFSEPTEFQIKQAVMSLKLSNENFIILESSTPINSINFIQATGYEPEDNTVYAEVQRAENVNGKITYRVYSQTLPIDSLYGVLTAFLEKTAPNMNDWDYMMDL